MSEEIRKWLADITGAIQHIDIHLGGKRDFNTYQTDITARQAVSLLSFKLLQLIFGLIVLPEISTVLNC